MILICRCTYCGKEYAEQVARISTPPSGVCTSCTKELGDAYKDDLQSLQKADEMATRR